MKKGRSVVLDFFVRFPIWWFLEIAIFSPSLLKKITLIWDDHFSVRLNLRMLFIPMFQDTTFVGRLLSLFFRTVRILIGTCVVFVVVVASLLTFCLWLLFPFLAFSVYGWRGLLIAVIAMFLFYSFVTYGKPKKVLSEFHDQEDPFVVSTNRVRFLLRGESVKPLSLFVKLWDYPNIKLLLRKLSLSEELLVNELSKKDVEEKFNQPISTSTLLQEALEEARLTKARYIHEVHLLVALVRLNQELQRILAIYTLHLPQVRGAVQWLEKKLVNEHPPRIWDEDFEVKLLGGVNRGWTSRPTPTLDSFSRDLTKLAVKRRLPKVIGREKVVGDIIRILSRSKRDNVMLLGEPGCGKTTMVGGLAQKIIEGNAPDSLLFKRVILLEVSSLLAGAKNVGEVGKRILEIINEIVAAGNIILFIDEIHLLVESESEEAAAVFSALEPHLDTAEFNAIAATSFENYRKYIETNESFARVFQNVEVLEASTEEAIEIVEEVAEEIEKEHKVTISYPAVEAAVLLSQKYMHDRVLPDKAIDLLDEAAVTVTQKQAQGLVKKEDVANVVVSKTNIPVSSVTQEEVQKLLHLEEMIHSRIIGQDEAVRTVSDALRRARTGLRSEKRPIGVLLFLGPTGVGKTELSKVLSEVYFGSQDAMIRVDMSEYQTLESINKLMGMKGMNEHDSVQGFFTDAVRRKPFSLILLDELEKAHSDVLNVFLQVFEDGRLTDNFGNTVDFTNTIIIATSNAEAVFIQDTIRDGKIADTMKHELLEKLRKTFRPEFLNRFDGIVVFKPLTQEDVLKIAQLLIDDVKKRLSKQEIRLEVTEELIQEFAKRGYSPMYGARPLRRLIQDTLESTLAQDFLSGKIKKGTVVTLGMEIFHTS
ncbi:MAG TPA: ATP-dependent Clp protease ATP-binding subunit [Patescibacteria group bacterium]|nr:ATP-dependent Clp protease ATP-binding subunit [Patescibacteria group bacterium]